MIMSSSARRIRGNRRARRYVVIPTVPPGTDLLLYSDGALELPVHSGREFLRTDFVDLCSELARETDWSLDTLVERLRASTLAGQFDDDCSLVLLRFD
jgi:serine phosphatase RsbU (regulator of sigma subunit)